MLHVTDLVKQFAVPARRKGQVGDSTRRNGLDGVTFEVTAGELFTLLGPSGCGKTTTLRSIAGLESPDSGRITLRDTVLFDSATNVNRRVNQRGLAMVFQSYAIWPHMTVFENAAFPLRVTPRRARPSDRQITERVDRALQTVGLDSFAGQSATRLSGGQQQRLALARSLVVEPPVLLLDEPLSNLDAKLRDQMRVELKRLQRDMGLTAIYVTHDQSEALSMSSRLAIMERGRIEQMGRPREVYGAPASHFVADFLGASNFVDGTLLRAGVDGTEIRCEIGVIHGPGDATHTAGESVVTCLRPEELTVSTERPAGRVDNLLEGRLLATAFLGDRVDHVVSVGGKELRVRSHSSVRIKRDATVFLTIAATDVVVLRD